MRPSDNHGELGRRTGSQDEQEWFGTPDEMLGALLNRPAPLSPIQSDGTSTRGGEKPDQG
jgi:hypothetical protein